MAVDYLFVGSTFMFVTSFVGNILGWEFMFSGDILTWSDFAKGLFFLFLAMMGSIMCGWLLLSTDTAMMIPVMYFFWGVAFIDFIGIMILSLQGLDIWREERRRY